MAKYLKVMLKWEPDVDGMTYQGEEALPEKVFLPLEGGGVSLEMDFHDVLEDLADYYGWVVKFHEFSIVELDKAPSEDGK